MNPQVGWWYTYCCEIDLYQIEDAEELADLLDANLEVPRTVRFWPTREEALEELSKVRTIH